MSETDAFVPLRVDLHLGDCLEVMPTLASQGVKANFVFADLPYGITKNEWDIQVSLGPFWRNADMLTASNAAILCMARQPFSSVLVTSSLATFRYELVWVKHCPSNGNAAKRRPLDYHESVLVFYKKQPTYTPQMAVRTHTRRGRAQTDKVYVNKNTGQISEPKRYVYSDYVYPRSVLTGMNEGRHKSIHPTQKPVALLDWLIKTYTNVDDTVFDPTAGSFTTAVSAVRNGRHCIAIEKDPTYFAAGVARVKAEIAASGAQVDLGIHT